MAFQTLTSSTIAPAATGTSNTGASNADFGGRNSIPFSFLIAFLALFVAFMTVGLCARRIVYFIRLQLGLPVPQPRQKVPQVRVKKPVLWDVYPERRVGGRKWNDIDPLSVWFLRQAEPSPMSQDWQTPHESDRPLVSEDFIPRTRGAGVMRISSPPPPTSATRTLAVRLSRPDPVRNFRQYWQELFHPTTPFASPEKTEIESLRVAVLVAMPSQDCQWGGGSTGDRKSTGSSSSGSGNVGEVALGISEVRWQWGESVLDEGNSSSGSKES